MSDVSIAHLESLRASCLAAMTSCQSAIQHIEALIADADASDKAPADEFAHLTFEDNPAPTIRRRPNGKR
jgi:hypothetical protein